MWDLAIHVFSHIGNSREIQEDNYLLCDGEYLLPFERDEMGKTRSCRYVRKKFQQDKCIVAVSDGMGGHECGEEASLLTVRLLQNYFNRCISFLDNGSKALIDMLENINKDFITYTKNNPVCKNMGATLCGIFFGEKIWVFNIGDSRAYQYFSEHLTQISVDHTEGQRLIDKGFLNEEEVSKLYRRKAIYSYISHELPKIDVFCINEFKKNSFLLLCTDGLTDALSNNEIQAIMQSKSKTIAEKGYELVDKALQYRPNFGDNITFIIIENNEGE